MDLISFVQLLGGLAFFLFGMTLLSDSLKKSASGKLEKLLKKATDNKFKGVIVGALITIAIQSSSAMTVMLVGFVNSGIMELSQTIGVIFGSEIGTTLTAWILSMSGLSSDHIILQFLKPKVFSLVVALVGVIMIMGCKKQRKKDIGTILVGFGILMEGMSMMSDSMAPLKEMESFTTILTAFNNPILGVLASTVLTGIIQSSAATIGILQSLCLTGQMTYAMVFPMVMGANIGTCATAIISSFGASREAKRVSIIHISINIIGTILWMTVYCILMEIFDLSFMHKPCTTFGIAGMHSVFNIVNTIVLMPFSKQIVAFSKKIVKEKEEEIEIRLDERLMVTPSIAVGESENSIIKMMDKTIAVLDSGVSLIREGYKEDSFAYIMENEDKVDQYEDHIGSYLMKLTTTQHLSEEDKNKSSMMLQAIGEFERISDHASYFAKSAEELKVKGITFSHYAKDELDRLLIAVSDCYHKAIECYRMESIDIAKEIGPLRIVISEMCDSYKATHVERLTSGICTAQQGFVFNDILNSCGRIADHSMNIAAIVYRFSEENRGAYMHDFKQRKDPQAEKLYDDLYNKYMGNEQKE